MDWGESGGEKPDKQRNRGRGFAALQYFRITAQAEALSPFCGAALEVKPPLGLGKGWLGSKLVKGREAEIQSRGERTQITEHRSLVTGTQGGGEGEGQHCLQQVTCD